MSQTSLPSTLVGSGGLRRWTVLGALLLAVVAMSSASWATSCSGFISLNNHDPQVTCVMPQTGTQEGMTFGMQFMAFAPKSEGMVLVYNSSLQLADVVTFSNVGGIASITFDANVGSGFTVPNMPVLGSFTENSSNQGYFFLSLAMTNGKDLHVGICTSSSSACNGGGDSLKVSVGNVPEPGTLFLFGTGLIAPGAWTLAKGKFARRFLKQIKT
jgi:hypothetical protein